MPTEADWVGKEYALPCTNCGLIETVTLVNEKVKDPDTGEDTIRFVNHKCSKCGCTIEVFGDASEMKAISKD